MCCSVQVLQSCHDFPQVVEILVNSYERLKPTKKWRAAIPDDCYKVVKERSVSSVCRNHESENHTRSCMCLVEIDFLNLF